MSKTIQNEVICAFDVDQTLVLWNAENNESLETISIFNPYDNHSVNAVVHKAHVRLLLQMKARGRFIIVWSAGGFQWAEAVVKALGLENKVDLIMTKPMAYVDDLPVQEWLQHRIYIPSKESL